MLKLEDVNKEIERLEQSERLTRQVCADLSGLYMIRDHMECTDPEVNHETHKDAVGKSRSIDLNIYPSEKAAPHFDRAMAEKWAAGLQNDDGTTGPHWPLEQTKQVQAQRGISGDTIKFWIALNASYSDLCTFFRKYGIDNLDAYVDYAVTFWLEDKDAVSDKLAAYYDYIVKH